MIQSAVFTELHRAPTRWSSPAIWRRFLWTVAAAALIYTNRKPKVQHGLLPHRVSVQAHVCHRGTYSVWQILRVTADNVAAMEIIRVWYVNNYDIRMAHSALHTSRYCCKVLGTAMSPNLLTNLNQINLNGWMKLMNSVNRHVPGILIL